MQEFNTEILETMKNQVGKIKSVYEVCEFCKKGNQIANEEYLKKYPTHKDLLSIIERAVTILESNIIHEYNESIVENVLTDIEFIIGQNVLTESHIQRLLLSPMRLQEFPIFKKRMDNINDRLNELYNCESSRFYYKYDELKANLPFNYQQVNSYLRYNKVGLEEELIDNDYNGDYVIEHVEVHFNPDSINKINEAYPQLEHINIIDKFRLEQHGLKPIKEGYNQFIHYKNGKQYNIYKSNGEYYMITESRKGFKSYKITINDKPVNITLESLYNGRK